MTGMLIKLLSFPFVEEAFSLAHEEFVQSGTYASRSR